MTGFFISMKTPDQFRIVFMGTPAFAVPTLDLLNRSGYDVAAVVTAPDKPAGRGLKLQSSAVKQKASALGLPLFQPVSLKDEAFIKSLADLQADLFVVVAFRMLPEQVWKLPAHGTINLHASLLPQYRGAAPINWALINGETKTGLTTFFINHAIDTGHIILQKELEIGATENAGMLHDRMMTEGAGLVLETVDLIREGRAKTRDQKLLMKEGEVLRTAPRLFKEDCRINWHQKTIQVFNLARGLSPWPAAFTTLNSPDGKSYSMKILGSAITDFNIDGPPGKIYTDNNRHIYIRCADGALEITEVQLAGKSKMPASDFLKGFRMGSGWTAK